MDMHYRQTQADAEVLMTQAEEKRLSQQMMDGESDHEDGVGDERYLRGRQEDEMAGDERIDIPQVDGEGGDDDKESAKQSLSASSKLLDKARKLQESSKFQKRGSVNALTLRPVRLDGKDGVEIGGSSKGGSKSNRGKDDSGTGGDLSRGRKGRDGDVVADAGPRGRKSKVGDVQVKEKRRAGVHVTRQDTGLAQKGAHSQEAHRRSIDGEKERGDSERRLLSTSKSAKGRGSRSRARQMPTLSPTDMVFYEPSGKRGGESEGTGNGKGGRPESTEKVSHAEEDASVEGGGGASRPPSSASRALVDLEHSVAEQLQKRHDGEGMQVVDNVGNGNIDGTEERFISVSRADVLQYPESGEGRHESIDHVALTELRSDGHDAVFATPRPVAKKADVSSPGVNLSITQLSHQQSPPIATLEPSVANGPTQLTAQQSMVTPLSYQVIIPHFSFCDPHECIPRGVARYRNSLQ